MHAKFNLVDDPWIKVRWLDGSCGRVGISDLFQRAGEIASIENEWAHADIAVLRLLTTILRRVATPTTAKDSARLVTDGLPVEACLSYLTKWRERFELFHGTRPFMQYPLDYDVDMTLDYATSMSKLVHFMATGSNTVFFDRRRNGRGMDGPGDGIDDEYGWPVDYGDAALLLVSWLAWATAGGNNLPVGWLMRGPMMGRSTIINWLTGRTLSETLALNTLCEEVEPAVPGDLPCWELEDLTHITSENYMRHPTGPLDLGAFLSRRMLLLPTNDGMVAKVIVRQGFGIPDVDDPDSEADSNGKKRTLVRLNPWAAYSLDEDGKFEPARADWLRGALWRNAAVVLGLKARSRPPLQIAQLAASGLVPTTCRVWGLMTSTDDKCNRVESSYIEQFNLPATWPHVPQELASALEFASIKASEANSAARNMLAAAMSTPTLDADKDVVTKQLEGHRIVESMKLRLDVWTTLLQRIADGDLSAVKEWNARVFAAHREVIQEFTKRLPFGSRSFRAIALHA